MSSQPPIRSSRRKPSIRTLLIGGFGLILVLALLVAVIGYLSLLNLQTGIQTTVLQADQLRQLSLIIENDFLTARQNENSFLTSWPTLGYGLASMHYVPQVRFFVGQARDALNQLSDLLQAISDPELRNLGSQVSTLRPLLDRYEAAFNAAVIDIRDRTDPNTGLDRSLEVDLEFLESVTAAMTNTRYHVLVLQTRANEQAYFNSGQQQYIDNIRLAVGNLIALLQNSVPADLAGAPADVKAAELVNHANSYLSAFQRVGALDQDLQVNTTVFQEVSADITPIADTLIKQGEAGLARARAQLQMVNDQSTLALGVTSVTALGLSILVALILARLIIRPLHDLSQAATEIGQGQLSPSLPASNVREISDLSDTMGLVAGQLRDLIGSLESRIQARTAQLEASADVGRPATSILDIDQLLQQTVNLITDRFGFYYAALFTLDETGQWAILREATGEAGRLLKERGHQLEVGGQSMVGFVTSQRKARIALDVGAEAVRFANPLLPGTRSEIALPLVVGERIIGALDVQSTEAAAFDEPSASVLQSMANQVAIAVSNSQQFQETEAAFLQTSTLYNASQDIARANTAQDILVTLLTYSAPDADRGAIILFGPGKPGGEWSYLDFMATWDRYADETLHLLSGMRYTVEQLPIVRAISSGSPLLIENVEAETVEAEHRRVLNQFNVKAAIGVALSVGQTFQGMWFVGYREPHTFAYDEVQMITALASPAAIAIQNQQLLAETRSALEQLDAINRRLTGQAWREFALSTPQRRSVAAGPSAVESQAIQASLSAPIALRGEVIGELSLEQTDRPRTWSADEIALLQTVAREVAIAVENARLIEQTERRAQRERTIAAISERIYSTTDVKDLLRVTAEELRRATGSVRTVIRLGRVDLQPDASTIQPVPADEGGTP